VKGEKSTCSLQGLRVKTGRFFKYVKVELIFTFFLSKQGLAGFLLFILIKNGFYG